MRRSERFYLGIYRDSLGSSWAVFDRSRPPSWSGSHDPILWLADPGAFMQARGPAKPAAHSEFQHDDPDDVWGKREATHG